MYMFYRRFISGAMYPILLAELKEPRPFDLTETSVSAQSANLSSHPKRLTPKYLRLVTYNLLFRIQPESRKGPNRWKGPKMSLVSYHLIQ
jgi:hypothetical protein